MNNATFEVTITKDQGTTVKLCNHTVSERQKQGRSQRYALDHIEYMMMGITRGTELIAMASGKSKGTVISYGCDLT